MKKIKIGILGATSYTGTELVRLLYKHNSASIVFIASHTYAGKKFSQEFPEFLGICDDTLVPLEQTHGIDVDCVFSCLPHAVSAPQCEPFLAKGKKVIDLSADYRIKDPAVFSHWYKEEHHYPQRLAQAVFGLCEHHRNEIAKAQLIANPGCYPTSVLMPLIPLLKDKKTNIISIIADSKSGVSGAGRNLKITSHFVEVNDNFSAYSIGRKHRHIAEIDQELSAAAGKKIEITFSPHLLPINRGILTTIYFSSTCGAQECLDILKKQYASEPFVRVREPADLPNIRDVAHTNFCDMTVTGGTSGQPLIAVCAIDNLIKGASGQALQNMNIMFGIEETTGLK